ncbi:toll/interleukin-1 receptor domain-containing protein [Halobacillus amylolyticus]|uniref:Toll/interleukin-1 receptor domain-containing protein n=1 Tax=Halobacillus amylolyticus TaxID=2932259 RepID=A0ABY4HDI7_9BACI|nr:toll/interleukin-1 receptor domain-containing protein [Halobacillus amylolyticus]UOR12631.1 toll/interleukin-1 receptor domain-containing protein [Halobacillus amylolyticus]
MLNEPKYDFFISYNHKDKGYAEWIAWLLEDAGYSTYIQAWDFTAGNNFILAMQEGATYADKTLALLSESYLSSDFTQPEWAAAFGADPKGTNRKFIPVRIQDIKLDGLLPQIIHIDLVGKDEGEAKRELLKGVQMDRKKPLEAPKFPGKIPAVEKPVEIIPTDWYQQWLDNRIDSLNDDQFSNEIMEGAKLVLHIIPLASINKEFNIPIKELKQPRNLMPFYTTGWDYKVNKDGYCTFAKWPQSKLPHGYVQFFRNGIIEAVDTGILEANSDKFIPYVKFEKDILKHIKTYIEAINNVGLKFPVAISISLLDICDYFVSANPKYPREKIKVDTLKLPVAILNSSRDNIDEIMKDSFDYLWNHCGFERSLNFDENGNWVEKNSFL